MEFQDQEIVNVSAAEVEEQAKKDLDFFGALALPEDVIYAFPDFYHQFWAILISVLLQPGRNFEKFALGLPRGHGKTFVMKLLVLFAILYSNKRFILIVSATKENAQNILADIADMLDSDNILQVYGNWRIELEIDRQDKKKFTFRGRSIILKSASAGTSVRGIQEKNSRPDLILCDDLQDRESAQSVPESIQLMRWFVATLLKACSPFGCTSIYIGNMYPDILTPNKQFTCILRNLQRSKYWTSLIVGGILADGKALWEELRPLEELLKEFDADCDLGQPEVFYAEVLNSPQPGQSAHFDRTRVAGFEFTPQLLPSGSFIMIDPSGSKKKSDDTAMAYFEVHDNIPILRELESSIKTPKQTIRRAIEWCVQFNCSCIVVESVAYQSTLCFWINEALEELQLNHINIVEIYPGGRPKTSRILTMLKQWQAGELRVAQEFLSLCTNQAITYDPLRSNNIDDILDILAYSVDVVKEHPAEIQIVLQHETFEDWCFQRSIQSDEPPRNCLVA